MQLNIDGLPSHSPDITEFFGREIEKLGVTMLALQDTRRTTTSGTALARQVDNGRNAERHRNTSDPKDAERWTWRHEHRMHNINIGGVTMALRQGIDRWVGHDKAKTSAYIQDHRKLGRYHAIKLLGKKPKDSQIQRSMLIINIYAPQKQGAWAKAIAGKTEGEHGPHGEVATKQLITDLANVIRKHNTPGTAIIMTGDLNAWLQDRKRKPSKTDTMWKEKIIEEFDLTHVFGEDDTQKTYITRDNATWPDHTYVSTTLQKYNYVRNPTVLTHWKRYRKDKGMMNSVHVPTTFQVNVGAWLERDMHANYTSEIKKPRPRVLKYTNKKQRAKYQEAMKRREKDPGIPTESQAKTWLEEAHTWQQIPEEVQRAWNNVMNLCLKAEADIAHDKIRTRRQYKGYSKVWTPDIANRQADAMLLKRILNANHGTIWRATTVHKIARRYVKRIQKRTQGYSAPELTIPSKNATKKTIEKWQNQTKTKLRRIISKLHAKRLKQQQKGLKDYKLAMKENLERRELGQYIDRALGRTRQRLPQHLQVTRVTETGRNYQEIISKPEALKQALKESTWEELGKPNRNKWFIQNQETHDIAKMNETGQELRRKLCQGENWERDVKRLQTAFRKVARTMKAKKCTKGKYEGKPCPETEYSEIMNDIDKETWRRKLRAKKKNTAPGENNIRIDHVAAATPEIQEIIRIMCNMTIRSKGYK